MDENEYNKEIDLLFDRPGYMTEEQWTEEWDSIHERYQSSIPNPLNRILAVLGICALVAFGYMACLVRHEGTKSQLAQELAPYVEMSDGRSGISFRDQLDFAEKAGVPDHRVTEGKFDFRNYGIEELQSALDAYERDAPNF